MNKNGRLCLHYKQKVRRVLGGSNRDYPSSIIKNYLTCLTDTESNSRWLSKNWTGEKDVSVQHTGDMLSDLVSWEGSEQGQVSHLFRLLPFWTEVEVFGLRATAEEQDIA